MSAAAPLSPPAPRRGLQTRLARIDDGLIVKFAFFAMLAGTAAVLYLDYGELMGDVPLLPAQEAHTGNPVLPAVERPEIDPDNPAYRPLERIGSPSEALRAPMEIALVSGGVLMMTGTIVPGTADRLAAELAARGEYVAHVALDSPGGAVEDALRMSTMIREGGYGTVVGDGALCASSCPIVLAGGAERIVSERAVVGVHQVYASAADGAAIGAGQAMSDAQATTARISRHLLAMEIDPALWLHALETPPDRLYYLTPEEVKGFNLATTDTAP